MALLKIGFRYDEILEMPEGDAWQYLDDWQSMTNPEGSGKKFLVKRT